MIPIATRPDCRALTLYKQNKTLARLVRRSCGETAVRSAQLKGRGGKEPPPFLRYKVVFNSDKLVNWRKRRDQPCRLICFGGFKEDPGCCCYCCIFYAAVGGRRTNLILKLACLV